MHGANAAHHYQCGGCHGTDGNVCAARCTSTSDSPVYMQAVLGAQFVDCKGTTKVITCTHSPMPCHILSSLFKNEAARPMHAVCTFMLTTKHTSCCKSVHDEMRLMS